MINRILNPVSRYLSRSFSLGFVHGLGICLVVATVASTQQVDAKDLEWDGGNYTHYSDQEPLKSFLESLAASQKTPIIMSDKIDTVISGYYENQTPRDIFLNVLKSNGLVWYYDGDTLFVEREEEMQTGSVSLAHVSASEFTNSLERLGVLDHHYQWIASDVDRMVYFKGPEPFVTAVLEMSKVLDKKISRPSIYRWVDDKGITNFSSDMPNKYKNNKRVRVIDGDKDHVMLGKPRVE